jgi:hypothetical protein
LINPFAVGVYVTAAIGTVGIVFGIFDALSSAGMRVVLGEDDLREIERISTIPECTWAQKWLLLESYFGMWIQISGTVVEVGEWTGVSSQLTIRTEGCDLTVFMVFKKEDMFKHFLLMLALGKLVTVIGKIEQIEPNAIRLDKCEVCRAVKLDRRRLNQYFKRLRA